MQNVRYRQNDTREDEDSEQKHPLLHLKCGLIRFFEVAYAGWYP